MPDKKIVPELHKRFIANTQPKMVVANKRVHICLLTKEVTKVIEGQEDGEDFGRVFLTSRCLKHLYDKKPAVEYDFIIKNIDEAIKQPKHIYNNKSAKRGCFVFRKKIQNTELLVSIEKVESPDSRLEYEVATCFVLRDEKYLKDYSPLWSWGDGSTSHRNALDAPEGSTHAPQ